MGSPDRPVRAPAIVARLVADPPSFSGYGPNSYPDWHHGWVWLLEDLALPFMPSGRGHPWEGRHIPLRWRLLVHYRRQGDTWPQVGRLFGISPQAASVAYHLWAPRLCCPPPDVKAA